MCGWKRGLCADEQFKKDFDRITETKIDLDKLLASISQKEKLSDSMTEEIDRMTLELNLPARVTVAEDAYVIQGIEGNRRLKYALMAGLGAFVLGFGGLVMWEHRSRRVTRTEEVSTNSARGSSGRSLHWRAGERCRRVPRGQHTPRRGDRHGSNHVDACRADGSKLRVLMVTSAVSGEGKTTLSGNLAISLTRAGFRTLLIDGDMQAPSAHLLFDLPDAPGLSEFLRGETRSGACGATIADSRSVDPARGPVEHVHAAIARWRPVADI